MNKNEQRLEDLWDTIKFNNIYVMRVPIRTGKRKEQKENLKK